MQACSPESACLTRAIAHCFAHRQTVCLRTCTCAPGCLPTRTPGVCPGSGSAACGGRPPQGPRCASPTCSLRASLPSRPAAESVGPGRRQGGAVALVTPSHSLSPWCVPRLPVLAPAGGRPPQGRRAARRRPLAGLPLRLPLCALPASASPPRHQPGGCLQASGGAAKGDVACGAWHATGGPPCCTTPAAAACLLVAKQCSDPRSLSHMRIQSARSPGLRFGWAQKQEALEQLHPPAVLGGRPRRAGHAAPARRALLLPCRRRSCPEGRSALSPLPHGAAQHAAAQGAHRALRGAAARRAERRRGQPVAWQAAASVQPVSLCHCTHSRL